MMTKQLAILLMAAAAAFAQDVSEAEAADIIRRFAAKEAEFARARENYTYRQRYRIEELDMSGRVIGKMETVADVIFTAEGKRTERVVFAPMNTLKGLLMTPEDEQDLRNVQPFVLTTREVNDYKVRYIGREKIDEIGAYVFAVKPKQMVEGRRYFGGMIWVDDRDMQIVKTYGRAIGIGKRVEKQRFPKFETWREQIDGKYWFPTYTAANDTLPFESGPLPIKMLVTYRDYKQFKSDVVITYGDEVDESKPAPKKK
ncbi:MAG: hypothetical protein C0504_10445 [Candidatus Solibacter sp.]|nr:hypothetical protein [Candidatus Solibacter sp.]